MWNVSRHVLVMWSKELSTVRLVPTPGCSWKVTPSCGTCPGVPIVLQAPPETLTSPPGATDEGDTVGACPAATVVVLASTDVVVLVPGADDAVVVVLAIVVVLTGADVVVAAIVV